jgi:hypothetical protein
MRTERHIGEPLAPPPERTSHTAPGKPSRWPIVALAVVGALLVAATGIVVWQRAQIGDRDDEIAALTAGGGKASARIEALTARVDRLETRLEESTAAATELRTRLREARGELETMLGPALPDGRHFGRFLAVGAIQDPPRLVIDVMEWFTDQEAVDAAIEDGVLPPGSTTIDNGYYIRNEDPRWRIVPIDPAAPVTISTYPIADPANPTVVDLRRFGRLFEDHPDTTLRMSPYWFTVEDGVVTAIEEQFVP